MFPYGAWILIWSQDILQADTWHLGCCCTNPFVVFPFCADIVQKKSLIHSWKHASIATIPVWIIWNKWNSYAHWTCSFNHMRCPITYDTWKHSHDMLLISTLAISQDQQHWKLSFFTTSFSSSYIGETMTNVYLSSPWRSPCICVTHYMQNIYHATKIAVSLRSVD